MAEDKPSLHIDTDWKKQAQEEKRKLAEQSASKPKEPAAPISPAGLSAAHSTAPSRGPAGQRQLPPASFSSLVQSVMTQVLFYLGDLSSRGGEQSLNLDMAKHQLDTLNVLEEKTANNLSEDEKRLLDTALYETRMRFVNVASQFT